MAYKPLNVITCVKCGTEKSIARKLCRKCYNHCRKKNTLENYSKVSPKDFFYEKTKKVGECWEWQGAINWYGYGIIIINGKQVRAHRLSYELSVKPIPQDMIILHTCDNPPCVNPAHLVCGTKMDNNRDAHRKGRRARGEKSHLVKITEDDAINIINDNRPQHVIAKEYSIAQGQVSRIKTGKRWKHLSR